MPPARHVRGDTGALVAHPLHADEIYTFISVILIAVNPFKRLALYSSQNIELHRTAEDMQTLLPHIFGVA